MIKKCHKFRELWIDNEKKATAILADDFSSRLLGLMLKK